MKYQDKQSLNWILREKPEPSNREIRRRRAKNLTEFGKKVNLHLTDKFWWDSLSIEQKNSVYFGHHHSNLDFSGYIWYMYSSITPKKDIRRNNVIDFITNSK